MIDVPSLMAVSGIAMMLIGAVGMWIDNRLAPPRED
jgi:hypothetical protein